MAQKDTANKILDASEILFAEKGFTETSLRMITTRAGVNLAAVNYHFGSKNELIQAVFARFLEPFVGCLSTELDTLSATNPEPSMEAVLKAITTALKDTARENDLRLTVFMRLILIAFTQSQGHVRRYVEREYSQLLGHILALIREASPELTPEERFWRMQFMLGSIAFSLSSMDALTAILKDVLGVGASVNGTTDLIVPFLAAGMGAPALLGTAAEN